jgi:DNA ligase-1
MDSVMLYSILFNNGDITMKPMLAAKADLSKIHYHTFCSPKIDGIRVIVKDCQVLSRTLKPIPNLYIQQELGIHDNEGLDGEITIGKPNEENIMQKTTSGVMSIKGTPNFTYSVFDLWNFPDLPYMERYKLLKDRIGGDERVILVPQTRVRNRDELEIYERVCLEEGYEGIMIRGIYSPYKYGRSTMKEGYLLKFKRFADDEAIIIGLEEQMHNENEAKVDALGYTKRSTHKDNKSPMNILGALRVKDIKSGIEFNIGTGFTLEQRVEFWDIGESLLGKTVKYKHFAVTGVKEAPRFPVFLGFRED